MEAPKLKIGDVVQINPGHDTGFGGCFMVVTELKPWGCQGFVAVPQKPVAGRAYYRAKFEDI